MIYAPGAGYKGTKRRRTRRTEVAGPYRSQSSNPKIRSEATPYEHRSAPVAPPPLRPIPGITAPLAVQPRSLHALLSTLPTPVPAPSTALQLAVEKGIRPNEAFKKQYGPRVTGAIERARIGSIDENLIEPEDLTNLALALTGVGDVALLAKGGEIGGKVAADATAGAVAGGVEKTAAKMTLKDALRGLATKAEPQAFAAARKRAAEVAAKAPLPVRIAAKGASKALSYPVKHPFTAPLSLQTPLALAHGDPGQYLKALEGKGVYAGVLKTLGGLAPAPLLAEATNLPATVLPATFLTGKAGFNALANNDPAEVDKLLEEWKRTGILPAIAEGSPSKALSAFSHHPLYSGLELSGAASALGRGAGIAARSLPGDFGSVSKRPTIPIEGTPTSFIRGNHGAYSPDLLRQYFPRYGERAHDRRVSSVAPDSISGRHYLKESINRKTVGDRSVEVMRNREALKALKDLLPRKGPTVTARGRTFGLLDRKHADIVGLAVERIFHDPSTFQKDLPAYKQMIEDAAKQTDANGVPILGPEELKRNRENVKILERGIKSGFHGDVVKAANAFVELQAPILQKMVDLKLITHHQAELASAIPYARIHMNAQHGEPANLYRDLELGHKVIRKDFRGEARAHLAPPDENGKSGGFVGAHETAKGRLKTAEAGYVQAERSLATARAKGKSNVDALAATRDAAKQRVTVAKAEVRTTGAVLQTEPSRFSRRLRKEDVPSSGKENLRECRHRRSTPTS